MQSACIWWLSRSAAYGFEMAEEGSEGDGGRHAAAASEQKAKPPRARWSPSPVACSWLARGTRRTNGSTPLHLAAGVLPSPERLLLDANVSTAYQPDKRGRTPYTSSWSCWKGAQSAPRPTGRQWKDLPPLGWCRVVKYVCRQSQRRRHAGAGLLSSILNAQNINGRHCAVYAGNWTIFFCLVRNQRVRRA